MLVVALLLVACASDGDGPEPAAPQPDAPAPETPEAAPGERTSVVIALNEDVAKLNPQDGAGWHEWQVTFEIADALFERLPDGSSVPGLATSMEASDDGMTWIIELRDDVYFHNGDHMTAADVAWGINRTPDLLGVLNSEWSSVDEAVVVDDYTVEVRMSQPDDLLAWKSTFMTVLPADYFEEVGNDEFIRAPVGTGPYKFVEWIPDERIVLEAFDDHWRGRPEIDEVIFRIIPEESAQVAAVLTGEVDITQALSPESVEQIRASGGDVRTAGILNRNRLMIDMNVPPLDIKEVRQAINYAIDVDLICDVLLAGFCTPIPTGFHPAEAGYLDIEPYGYDPDRARELLAEAGFPDGLPEPLTMSLDGRELGVEDVGAAMADMLEAVGIPITIELQSPADFREGVTPPKTNGPLLFTSHSAGALFHVGNNLDAIYACDGNPRHSGYGCFPEVDALKNEARSIWASDQDRAIELYHEAQRILFDESPAGWLYYKNNHYGVNPALNWDAGPTEFYAIRYASWS